MFRFFIFSLIVLISANAATAQARRVPPRPTPTAASPATNNAPPSSSAAQNSPSATDAASTAAALYEDANTYSKRKFDEFARKQTPYTDELRASTLREQRQLAARYAAQIAAQNLSGEDFYYLGMLHLIADNADAAAEAMRKFLTIDAKTAEKAQTARSVVAVTAARRRNFDEAENALKEYLKAEPVRVAERVRIESELAKNFYAVKNHARAAFHAEAALLAAKPALSDAAVSAKIVDEVYDLALTLFDIHHSQNANAKAEAVLNDLQATGAFVNSTRLFAAAIDKLITFLIETGRKPEALAKLKTTLNDLDKTFADAGARARIQTFLKKREPQYKLLGEQATELVVDKWLAEKPVALANARGKVVLLDFWAHWCEPCYAAFPRLSDWYETYSKQGLEIIGVTRYYGQAEGFNADQETEFAFVQKIKRAQRLPYPIAVAKGTDNHRRFEAPQLPTMVLIDKKGVVRFVETGSNGADAELENFIKKLLAE